MNRIRWVMASVVTVAGFMSSSSVISFGLILDQHANIVNRNVRFCAQITFPWSNHNIRIVIFVSGVFGGGPKWRRFFRLIQRGQ